MNEYKIVKIIDDKTIVVNYGEEDGARIGDKLQILSKGEEVYDPETNESLGTLDTIKDIVEVINVLPRISICKNRSTYIRNFMTSVVGNFSYNEVQDKVLNVKLEDISGGLSKDLVIKIGDKVRCLKNESNNN